MTRINTDTLLYLAREGYLTRREHPTEPLAIWNYTPRTQFERHWTRETLMCRGLITDEKQHIIARPFPKFFNLEERSDPLPVEPFEVTEKMDGSLGILYWIGNRPCLATRGSFESEQAIHGTQILALKYGDYQFDKRYTYLFEIVYPANRIVVDYGKMDDVILLAVIETSTGSELSLDEIGETPFPKAKVYDGITDITQLRQMHEDNKEGFVVRFKKSGLRVKIKMEEYVRLHRLLTQVSSKTIWEMCKANQPITQILDHVPDEFYAWVRNTEATLKSEYTRIEGYCLEIARQVSWWPRNEAAVVVTKSKYPGIIFAILDGKNHREMIWKLLKPKFEKPFREGEAA